VQVGIADATHIQVRAGLTPGERVVTGPYRVLKDLSDGESLRIATDTEAGPATAVTREAH
jgi:hypothetical protein